MLNVVIDHYIDFHSCLKAVGVAKGLLITRIMSFVHNHHRRSERKRVSDVKIDIDAVDDVETFLVPEEFLLADYDPKM